MLVWFPPNTSRNPTLWRFQVPKTGSTPIADQAWSIPDLREPRYSQSLERGLAILASFSPSRPVLGIADIADELGMSRSTTHRYVITLVALGYLEQVASRKYRLGLKVVDLGMSALNATGLREHARPFLEDLRNLTSLTVSLGILDGAEVVYTDRAQSFKLLQRNATIELGSRTDAYSSAMGKVLLAYLPSDEQRNCLSAMKLTRKGPNTIISKKGLLQDLAPIPDEGFAINDEESAKEVRALAVPVRNEAREVVAALGVSAYGTQFSAADLLVVAPHVISTADRLSARLGYRRDSEVAAAA